MTLEYESTENAVLQGVVMGETKEQSHSGSSRNLKVKKKGELTLLDEYELFIANLFDYKSFAEKVRKKYNDPFKVEINTILSGLGHLLPEHHRDKQELICAYFILDGQFPGDTEFTIDGQKCTLDLVGGMANLKGLFDFMLDPNQNTKNAFSGLNILMTQMNLSSERASKLWLRFFLQLVYNIEIDKKKVPDSSYEQLGAALSTYFLFIFKKDVFNTDFSEFAKPRLNLLAQKGMPQFKGVFKSVYDFIYGKKKGRKKAAGFQNVGWIALPRSIQSEFKKISEEVNILFNSFVSKEYVQCFARDLSIDIPSFSK